MTVDPKPQRRTQSQRREATRAGLLDATIECLVESGYANTTTADIAKRAGVTRGAQAHHFPTKAELVTVAVRHLTEKLIVEHMSDVPKGPGSVDHSLNVMLDRLWEMHSGDLFAAASELWIAGRTDPELAGHVESMEADIVELVRSTGAGLLPPNRVVEGSGALIATTMATIRGLAMLTFVRADHQADKEWVNAKQHLVSLWREALAPAGRFVPEPAVYSS